MTEENKKDVIDKMITKVSEMQEFKQIFRCLADDVAKLVKLVTLVADELQGENNE